MQQYSGDISKRIKRMEDEVARLSRNQTLSAEEKKLLVLDKYNIVFKPLLYVFEKVGVKLYLHTHRVTMNSVYDANQLFTFYTRTFDHHSGGPFRFLPLLAFLTLLKNSSPKKSIRQRPKVPSKKMKVIMV